MGRVTRRKTYQDVDNDARKTPITPSKRPSQRASKVKQTTPKTLHSSGQSTSHVTPARPKAVFVVRQHSPYVDDGFPLSQAPGEVGWDARAQYPDGDASRLKICDILKNLKTDTQKKDRLQLDAMPGTPPNLDLWRRDSPLSQDEAVDEVKRYRKRQVKGRPRGIKSSITCKEMLANFQAALQEEKEREEPSPAEVELRRSERVSQKPPAERSFDLFDTCPSPPGAPSATVKKSPVMVSTPKRAPLNQSCEDLWTDDERFDESFMKATHAIAESAGFLTPKGIPQKRKNCATPKDGLSRKNGRFTKGPTTEQSSTRVTSSVKSNDNQFTNAATKTNFATATNKMSHGCQVSNTTPPAASVTALKSAVVANPSSRGSHLYSTRNAVSRSLTQGTGLAKNSVDATSAHALSTSSGMAPKNVPTGSLKTNLPFQSYKNPNIAAQAANTNSVSSSMKSGAICQTQSCPSNIGSSVNANKPRFQRHQSMPASSTTTSSAQSGNRNNQFRQPARPSLGPSKPVSQQPRATGNPSFRAPPKPPPVSVGNLTSKAMSSASTLPISPPPGTRVGNPRAQLSPHNMSNTSLAWSCSQFGKQALATSTQLPGNGHPGQKDKFTNRTGTGQTQVKNNNSIPYSLPPSTKPTAQVTQTSTTSTAMLKTSLPSPAVYSDSGLDVSISDDLLMELAEPDDLLDSQACMQMLESPNGKDQGTTSTSSQGPKKHLDYLDCFLMDDVPRKTTPTSKKTGTPNKTEIEAFGCDSDDDALLDADVLTMIEEVELRASQEKTKELSKGESSSEVTVKPATRGFKFSSSRTQKQPEGKSNVSDAAINRPSAPGVSKTFPSKPAQFPAARTKAASPVPVSTPQLNPLLASRVSGNSIQTFKGKSQISSDSCASRSDSGGYASGRTTIQTKPELSRVSVSAAVPNVKTGSLGVMSSVPQPKTDGIPKTQNLSRVDNLPIIKSNSLPKQGSPSIVPSITKQDPSGKPSTQTISGRSSDSGTIPSKGATSSPIKYSREEIERKRMEALKKRQNRLKLSKKTSVGNPAGAKLN